MEDNINNFSEEALRLKIKQLRIEHRELDTLIGKLHKDILLDHLEIQRLKKRKLLLKDMLWKLQSQLIPDLNA